MKNIKIAFVAFILGVSPALAQRGGDQGVGVMVGNPSGLSYKFWLDDVFAIDGAFGIARSELDLHATLLWHNFAWSKNATNATIRRIANSGAFPFYIGVGPRVLFEENTEFGIRLPVGLSYFPNNTTWEFFGEVAPVLRVTPDSGFNGDIAIGARYYFPAVRPRITE